jgi:hypothetical protein
MALLKIRSGIIEPMGRVAILGLLLLLGLVLMTPADAGQRSGVSGRVTLDGMCPLPYTPCEGPGVPATIKVRRARSGRLVRTVHTKTGDFRIRLRPGRYRLRATADSGNGAGGAQANVHRRRFTKVVIRLTSPAR